MCDLRSRFASRRRVWNLTSAALVWLVGGGLAGGCLFTPRSPEQPGSGQIQVPWVNPTSAAILLQNIQVTFGYKSVDNYTRSLADDYTFVPDPADVSQSNDPVFWQNFGKQQEVVAFTNILKVAEGETVTFTWGTVGDPLGTSTNGEYYFKDQPYQLKVNRGAPDTVFSGKADIYVRDTGSLFYLFKWVDKRDGSHNSTLGLVRWKGRIDF